MNERDGRNFKNIKWNDKSGDALSGKIKVFLADKALKDKIKNKEGVLELLCFNKEALELEAWSDYSLYFLDIYSYSSDVARIVSACSERPGKVLVVIDTDGIEEDIAKDMVGTMHYIKKNQGFIFDSFAKAETFLEILWNSEENILMNLSEVTCDDQWRYQYGKV